MTEDVTYYAVAAQVIPVLALVLAVEMRAFDLVVVPAGKHDLGVGPRVFAFIAMSLIGATVAIAEVAALQVLFTQRPSAEAAGLVRQGLIFAGLLFGVMQLLVLRRLVDPLRLRAQALAWIGACGLVGLNVLHAWRVLDP